MIQQMQTKCHACSGTGSAIPEKDKCKGCHGEKTTKEKKTLEVFINKGMRNGEKIPYVGEADEAPDQTPGDVIVVLQQVENETFRREGANLFLKRSITLYEALTGFSFHLTHLDGRVLTVKSEPGMIVKPGDTKAVKDAGFPQHKNPYVRGHLYIQLDVEFPRPNSFSDKDRQSLLAVLPRPAAASKAQASSEGAEAVQPMEEVQLQDCDMREERARHAREQMQDEDEEDEDDEGRHGPQAQCRQQ